MGRAVRVKSQLKSHKRFANAFPRYCQLVDHARLYSSNSMGTAPKVNNINYFNWRDVLVYMFLNLSIFRSYQFIEFYMSSWCFA